MAIGSGSLETWHLVVLLVARHYSLFILWIMPEHVLQMMPRLEKREGRGNSMVWLMSTGRH
jgi:hypothetical protein